MTDIVTIIAVAAIAVVSIIIIRRGGKNIKAFNEIHKDSEYEK